MLAREEKLGVEDVGRQGMQGMLAPALGPWLPLPLLHLHVRVQKVELLLEGAMPKVEAR